METLIIFLGVCCLYAGNVLISNGLGWLATEFKGPLFRFKPFNCRPCFTFWVTLGFGLWLTSYVAHNQTGVLALGLVALLSAFGNFLFIKSQITITE